MAGREELAAARILRQGADTVRRLSAATVGVAGLGGLGSHIAVHLARLGVGRLVLADFDVVDVTNLHRQHYFLPQLGMRKTDALAAQLRDIDPYLVYETHAVRVTANNAVSLFQDCDVVCEAFDRPDQKAMLIETLLDALPTVRVVSGSGMAGFGSANAIRTEQVFRRLYICGDRKTDVEEAGSLAASRVAVCAAHEAHMALRLLLGEESP